MSLQKNDVPNLNQFSESLTLEEIREWRESIMTFFQEDWETVGNIVAKLEKSYSEEAAVQQYEVAEDSEYPVQNEYQKQSDVLGIVQVPVSHDPEQQRRLENLARKIEARLSHCATTSNSGGSR